MKLDNNTGNIWFTTFAAGTVGLVQKYEGNSTYNSNQSNYQVTEFPLGKSSYPSGLFLNGDSVWVTQTLDDKVIQFRMVKDAHGKVINILKVLEIQGSENKKLFLSPYDVVALTLDYGLQNMTQISLQDMIWFLNQRPGLLYQAIPINTSVCHSG